MGTLQVGGTTLGVKNTSTNKVDLSNAGDVNISGDITKDSLPMYACRAWVNFDGTKDTSGASSTDTTNRLILGSGNVASVLRTGTGTYTITFTTPMPDANYCVTGSVRKNNTTDDGNMILTLGATNTTYSTTGFHVTTRQHAANGVQDAELACCAVFR